MENWQTELYPAKIFYTAKKQPSKEVTAKMESNICKFCNWERWWRFQETKKYNSINGQNI